MLKLSRKDRKSLEKEVICEYADALPGWITTRFKTIARYSGPFLQAIWFDILSIDHFRPTCYIQILVADSFENIVSGEFLHVTPSISTAPLKFHTKRFPGMFRKMKENFIPNITEPIDENKLFRACVKDTVPLFYQAYALAPLYAYYGKKCKAIYWAKAYEKIVMRTFGRFNEDQLKQMEFLKKLQEWMNEGIEKEKLEEVRINSLKKWGFE